MITVKKTITINSTDNCNQIKSIYGTDISNKFLQYTYWYLQKYITICSTNNCKKNTIYSSDICNQIKKIIVLLSAIQFQYCMDMYNRFLQNTVLKTN